MEFIEGIVIFVAVVYVGYVIDKRFEAARKEHELTRQLVLKVTSEMTTAIDEIDRRVRRLSRLAGDE